MHRNVIDFVDGDTGLAYASERRVGSAFQSSSNRNCKFDQAATLLIQRASLVTALSQFVEDLPYFRMALAKLVDSLNAVLVLNLCLSCRLVPIL